ncbi:MBL fold metallo-hydrolase [Microbacterium azadirachtae]|uniref:MBL fold metallo-hydrolase n=1 Tax=Microbacterium azadirachtae TaxID=582680 RepID=UPI003F74B7B9
MTGRLRHFVCGSTAHDVGALFRGGGRGVRAFPAGVFLYETGDGRRILFDTGYAPEPWDAGWRGRVYRRILPPTVEPQEAVDVQLAAHGVAPKSITHLVLSHLHPDHIGGVGRFPGARLILTPGMLASYRRARLRDAILVGLLPPDFPGRDPLVLAPDRFSAVSVAGETVRVADPFGDGLLRLVDLPGHANGHLGALIEDRVLIAGDAAWGSDLLAAAPHMRALPRRLQHDPEAYGETARMLVALSRAGIRVVCSHDPLTDRELLG